MWKINIATFSREHYFTLVINKSIDISNLSYTWFWPQFTHCAVVFAQGKANFRVDKERFFLLKVFFFFLKASNLTQNFFCCRGQDNQSNLLFFLQMIRRERTKKKDDVFPNLPSLHSVRFLWFFRDFVSFCCITSFYHVYKLFEIA